MVDMINSKTWAEGSRYYEQLRLWLTWTTSGHELRALDSMNSSSLWMTCAALGHEFGL